MKCSYVQLSQLPRKGLCVMNYFFRPAHILCACSPWQHHRTPSQDSSRALMTFGDEEIGGRQNFHTFVLQVDKRLCLFGFIPNFHCDSNKDECVICDMESVSCFLQRAKLHLQFHIIFKLFIKALPSVRHISACCKTE